MQQKVALLSEFMQLLLCLFFLIEHQSVSLLEGETRALYEFTFLHNSDENIGK